MDSLTLYIFSHSPWDLMLNEEQDRKFIQELELIKTVSTLQIIFLSPNAVRLHYLIQNLSQPSSIQNLIITSSKLEDEPSPEPSPEIISLISLIPRISTLRSLTLGFQIPRGIMSIVTSNPHINFLRLISPNSDSLLELVVYLSYFPQLEFCGLGISKLEDRARAKISFRYFIEQLRNTPTLVRLGLNHMGFFSSRDWYPLDDFYCVLKDNLTLKQFYINFVSIRNDESITELANVMNNNRHLSRLEINYRPGIHESLAPLIRIYKLSPTWKEFIINGDDISK